MRAPWLFCFSSPSKILKIPNSLLNPLLIETLRVFSISCIESQPTQLLHIICWYGKNISCLSRLHTKSFCIVILFPFMFLISDGLWGPSKCSGLTYILLFTLRVAKSAPAFFKTSANTFSQSVKNYSKWDNKDKSFVFKNPINYWQVNLQNMKLFTQWPSLTVNNLFHWSLVLFKSWLNRTWVLLIVWYKSTF